MSKMANSVQTLCISFLLVLIQRTQQTVFLSSEKANQVIQRTKRANNILFFGEVWQGNLEQECLEEICTYEEAREIFEDIDKTQTFWKDYHEGRPCSSSPCKNEAVCTDFIRRYTCTCAEGYTGKDCQFGCAIFMTYPGDILLGSAPNSRMGPRCTPPGIWREGPCMLHLPNYFQKREPRRCNYLSIPSCVRRGPVLEIGTGPRASNECYPDAEDGCQHFCEPNHEHDIYTCSCASSYSLGNDEKSCHPTGPYACGQLLYNENSSLLGIQDNHTNSFPWQVLLLNSDGKPYCSGIILNQSLVLTTVKCSNQEGPIFILVGHNDTQNMQKIKVASHRVHTGRSNTEDHNIALLKLEEGIKFHKHILPICIPQKDFAENVLIAHAPGMVSGWTLGPDDMVMVPIQFAVTETDKQTCETAFNVTQSKRKYCGRSNRNIDSALADGSHVAIKHKGTWFLTGIMRSINNELWNPNVFTFTKISRYIMWLKENSS